MSYSKAQIAGTQLVGAHVATHAGVKIVGAKTAGTKIAAIGLLLFWSLFALASDVKVIANPSIRADSISAGELRQVFLAEQKTLKDGSHVEPVFERAGITHETFLRKFLRENDGSLQSHYGALVFTGKALMPKSFKSDAEVLAYVSRTRGAIGYVDASANSEGVKVLDVVPEGGRPSRALLIHVEPEYPEPLRQAGIGGTVRMQITISPQGRVETVDLLGGNPILGESAMKAVHQWVYVAASSRTSLLVTVAFGAQ